MRTYVRAARGHHPARRPRCVLRVGRATRRPPAARAARDRRDGRRALGELRSAGIRRPHRDGRTPGLPAVPACSGGPAPDVRLLGGEQGGVRGVRRHDAGGRRAVDRRGLPRRSRAGAHQRHAHRDRRAAPERRRRAAWACRSRSGWRGPSSSPRWRAVSRSPTGCWSCRPAASSPSSIRCRSSGCGASGHVTAGKLHGRGIRTVGQVARDPRGGAGVHARPGDGPAPPRPGPQPRSPAGAGRPAPGLDRVAARARPVAEILDDVDAVVVGLVDRVTRRLRAAGRVGRTVVLRLRFDDFSRATRSHTLPLATSHTQTILGTVRWLLSSAMPLIERRGLTLVGVAVANLDDDTRSPACAALPTSQRHRARRRPRRGARAVRIEGRHASGAARPRRAVRDAAAPRQLKAIDPRASLAGWSPPIRTTRTSVTRRASSRFAPATGSS